MRAAWFFCTSHGSIRRMSGSVSLESDRLKIPDLIGSSLRGHAPSATTIALADLRSPKSNGVHYIEEEPWSSPRENMTREGNSNVAYRRPRT